MFTCSVQMWDSHRIPAVDRVWDELWGRMIGGENLHDPLEMQEEREGRPQQVVYYKGQEYDWGIGFGEEGGVDLQLFHIFPLVYLFFPLYFG